MEKHPVSWLDVFLCLYLFFDGFGLGLMLFTLDLILFTLELLPFTLESFLFTLA